jgi:hypothetical protein
MKPMNGEVLNLLHVHSPIYSKVANCGGAAKEGDYFERSGFTIIGTPYCASMVK